MKKYLPFIILGAIFFTSVASATSTLFSQQVGTGAVPGYILSTNGANAPSVWIANPNSGSSFTTSTLAGLTATSWNLFSTSTLGISTSSPNNIYLGPDRPYYLASNPSAFIAGVFADSPLSGSGTSASHLVFTNPGYLSAAITSLNGSTSSTQTFATSSDANLGITIGTLNGVHTFTPAWIGTLADGRITSAANWNAKLSTPFTGNVSAGGFNLTGIGNLTATSATIGTLNISSLAQSPLIIGGSATTTIYGDGTTSVFGGAISATGYNSTNWNLAFTQTRQWDGGSTGLVAATGRTSLGLTDTATLASSTWLKVANNLSDGTAATMRTNLGLTDTATTASSTFLTKATNFKSIQWTESDSTSTASYDTPMFTFRTTSTIQSIYVSSRDSANTIDWNLVYSTDPTISFSTSFKVLSATNTTTSTPTNATLITSFASSTPGLGQTLRIYTANASTTATNWTIYYSEL